jgi:hypothetical protein
VADTSEAKTCSDAAEFLQAEDPWTAADFGSEPTLPGGTIPFVSLGEDGEYFAAWGHVDKATFAAEATAYARSPEWGGDPTITAEDVRHRWVVAVHDEDGSGLQWDGVTAETPGAFTVSVVSSE